MARYLYSELSTLLQARRNCEDRNQSMKEQHTDTILALVRDHFPHGSGYDSGTKFDFDLSHADKLVFHTSFHHMNNGFYDGWSEHTITVTPALACHFHIRISGRNRNDIKEMIHEDFYSALLTDITFDLYSGHFPELPIGHYWKFECPFCHVTWDNRGQNDTATARNAHTCDGQLVALSGIVPKSNLRPVNETQVFTWDTYEFKSFEDARQFAGEEMHKRFTHKKVV